eukprot:2647980-Amphidinium_carterae.1
MTTSCTSSTVWESLTDCQRSFYSDGGWRRVNASFLSVDASHPLAGVASGVKAITHVALFASTTEAEQHFRKNKLLLSRHIFATCQETSGCDSRGVSLTVNSSSKVSKWASAIGLLEDVWQASSGGQI